MYKKLFGINQSIFAYLVVTTYTCVAIESLTYAGFIWLNSKAWLGQLFLTGKAAALPLKIKLQVVRMKGELEYLQRFLVDKGLKQQVLKRRWLTA